MGSGISRIADGSRTFKIVEVGKHGSCRTKGKGILINKKPAGAAKEAFSELCRTKRIKGVCTLIVTIQEIITGKVFSYELKRIKLKKPIIRLEGTNKENVLEYKTTIKAIKAQVDCKKPGQTPGRPLKRTSRMNAMTIKKLKEKRKKSKKAKKN